MITRKIAARYYLLKKRQDSIVNKYNSPWWRKYQVKDLPEGQVGDYRIEKFIVSEKESDLTKLRSLQHPRKYVPPGTYTRLVHKDMIWMSDTPREIEDLWKLNMAMAKRGGPVLLNGLGLGVALKMAILSRAKKIIVVEISPEVIELVGKYWRKQAIKHQKDLLIMEQDALQVKFSTETRFTVVWNDIWPTICGDDQPQMVKLHAKFGLKADWIGSWCELERIAAAGKRPGGFYATKEPI